MERKYFIINLSLILLVLMFMGGIGYIIDPSQQVRYSSRYVSGEQRLVNLGLARNYKYTSIIIGSSTSENTLKKDVDKLFNTNSINLSLSGSTAYEHRKILKEVIKSDKCNLVIYGLDFFNYNWEVDEERVKVEDYSKNILKYLYNINTLKENIKIFLKILFNKNNQNWIEIWSYWGDDFLYSEEMAVSFNKNTIIGNQNLGMLKFAKNGYVLDKMKINFDEFLKIVEKNKEINYKVYFSPYSLLYWYIIKETNNLKTILEFKKYVILKAKKYPNIELYDFQLDESIVSNLNNYRDGIHFSPKINLEIINRIKNKKNRVEKVDESEYIIEVILEKNKEIYEKILTKIKEKNY